jgi:chemotaxis protein MotB
MNGQNSSQKPDSGNDDLLFDEEREKLISEYEREDKLSENDEEQDRSSEADHITQNLWMVSFADLMTILMIFFLSLFGYAYSGASTHYEKAVTALQKDVASKGERAALDAKEKEAVAAEQIETFIKSKDLTKFAKVETTAQKVKISFANPVLFDSGSAELKNNAVSALDGIAALIAPLDNEVIVEGHTDNVPISSAKYRSNFELSAARAFSVINYFIGQKRISPIRFSAFGYGEFRPLAANDNEDNRAKNRRIEINIIRKT